MKLILNSNCIVRIYFFFIFFFSVCIAKSQIVHDDPNVLTNLLKQESRKFKSLLDKKNPYEIQILYTQINRDQNNKPSFQTYQYNVDTSRYFYPASTIKFPMTLLALEKLNQLKKPLVNKYTPMYHDSVYSGQRWIRVDTTSEGGVASIAHNIKKVFVVSDNDAFNRLYEWVGQREANDRLKGKGYNIRVLHRLDRRLTPDQNRHTEAIRFAVRDTLLYSQPSLTNDSIEVHKKILKGKGYYEKGKLIRKPFNLSYRNFFSLPDQHEMLKSLIFPEATPKQKQFDLTPDDRRFVLQYMSQLPTETLYPPYYKDTTLVAAYVKMLMFGCEQEEIPAHIRIFNKVGWAYGYAIDNAYIVDFEAGVEFLLSAIIYTNKNEIFNDDHYEYEKVGFPFMKNLGQVIYDMEKSRAKKYVPDLSEFRMNYDIMIKDNP